MENEVINTIKDEERVGSTYAEIYLDHDFCNDKTVIFEEPDKATQKHRNDTEEPSVWVSPSDLLIGIIDLKPPFTSKITRGKTHEGILGIGGDILAGERALFLKHLKKLVNENDSAWNNILSHERESIERKVKEIYSKIFIEKSKVMAKEISTFYENTLQDLEKDLRKQVENVLMSTHANVISKLNTEIQEKLKKEKATLEAILKKGYRSEIFKIKKYYKLLLNNEELRSKYFIDSALAMRNDVLKAFIRQIEADNITSTMYVMSLERKKCRIKQFILENIYSSELKEKYDKIKKRQDVIDMFKEREVSITDINKVWEDKIKKILQLFLKFISFSLKLLPEQSTFLLNFEKMVILQLDEIQKTPCKAAPILVDADNFQKFKFEQMETEKEECTKDPFIIEGGYLSGTPVTSYGSSETIPDHVDLPTVRVQRQFVYAKCHHYEEIKADLEAARCKCMDFLNQKPPESKISIPVQKSVPEQKDRIQKKYTPSIKSDPFHCESNKSHTSYEPLLIDDIQRLEQCPGRNCQDWIKRAAFPYLNDYLDFDEEKYKRVLCLLDSPPEKDMKTKIIDPKDLIFKELPFSPTKEPYHTVETQYSSQEDLTHPCDECTCAENYFISKRPSHYRLSESPSKVLIENMTKRKTSLRRMMQKHPYLLRIFTDESFDFLC